MECIPVAITQPLRLWSRAEVLARPSPVPREPGLYGWYFAALPGPVDARGCLTHRGLTLLYVGIAPREPAASGAGSGATLRSRLRDHFAGNAFGSTLRLTLGCLLADELELQLRRVGSGTRLTFAAGEPRLSDWMAANAFICWTVCPAPWEHEQELVRSLSLPLNLRGNEGHPFHPTLSRIRVQARDAARRLDVVAK